MLIGDAEKLYEPQAMLKLAQRRMPGLEAAIVLGADHIAAMSQPDDVNGQIIRFLQKGGADKNGGRCCLEHTLTHIEYQRVNI
ncbi:alpha/beta fold hydrolase [Variovorax sp. ZT5P49]|uniref:alpha/beta fold hydrolase n=1 Tax=Variovorax sp. ZT5P49 TaxID=3443733 RepID=UPI003F47B573